MLDAALGEDVLQHAASSAVHHVNGELEARLLNRFQIDEVLDRRDVGNFEVGQRYAPALALKPWRIEFALDGFHDRRSTRAAVACLVLHAIPVERVVAGGDHY